MNSNIKNFRMNLILHLPISQGSRKCCLKRKCFLRIIRSFLLLVIFGLPLLGSSNENSHDLRIEGDFYSAIRAYDGQHLSRENWNAVVSQVSSTKGAESYQIQVHDTMWDVSRTFFGDGFFWPHLWAANEGVPNPHLLHLGSTLYFFPGSLSAPPAISVGGLPQQNADSQEPTSQPSAVRRAGLVIPPPIVPVVPLVRQLPPSLPIWQTGGASEKDYDETGVSIDKLVRKKEKDDRPLATIFTPDRPVSVGTIAEMDQGRSVGFPKQAVYLSLKSKFDVGDQLTIVRDLGQLSEKNKGHVIEFVGTVTLTVDLQDGKYMGFIDSMVLPVLVGDLVIDSPLKFYSPGEATSFNSVAAHIVGGESDLGRGLFSTQEMVFLDKGADHGLDKGQILAIFENRSLRVELTEFPNARRQIGHLQIVSVTPTTATAVIVENSDPIQVGDFTGGE